MFLDLQLDRPCPRPSVDARLGVNVVEQTAVAGRFGSFARRPLPFAPFELQRQVVVLEGALRPKLAEYLARDADRRPAIDIADDGEHSERIAARSDWLDVFPVRVPFQTRHL